MLISKKKQGSCMFRKPKIFMDISKLTFLFQLHHLEPLMTLFGRFNKVEARCETSGPKMLRKHVSLDLHLVKLMAFYITSWQAIASTPREQKIGYKICKTHHSRRFCCMAPTSSTRHPTCPSIRRKLRRKLRRKQPQHNNGYKIPPKPP